MRNPSSALRLLPVLAALLFLAPAAAMEPLPLPVPPAPAPPPPAADPNLCWYCKIPRPPGAKFCAKCGNPFATVGDKVCPKCKKVFRGSDDKFCPGDGEPLVLHEIKPDARKKPKVLILVRERREGWTEAVTEANDWNRSEGILRKFFFEQGYPVVDLDEAKKSLERGMDFYKLRDDERAAQSLALKLECEVVVKGEVRLKKFVVPVRRMDFTFDVPHLVVEADLAAVQAGAAGTLSVVSDRGDFTVNPGDDPHEQFLKERYLAFSEKLLAGWKTDEAKGQEIRAYVDGFSSAKTFDRILEVAKRIENVTGVQDVNVNDIGKGSTASFTAFYKGSYENFAKRLTDRENFKTFRLIKVRDAGNELYFTAEEGE